MCKDIIQVGQFHIIGLRGYQYVLDKLSRNLHGTCHCMYLQDSTDNNNCSYLECGVKSHEQVNLRLRPRCILQLDDTFPLLDGREKQGTFSPGKGVCGKYYYYYSSPIASSPSGITGNRQPETPISDRIQLQNDIPTWLLSVTSPQSSFFLAPRLTRRRVALRDHLNMWKWSFGRGSGQTRAA